ncbi:MAG: DUF4465 domain-containing protein [Bacteroidaceae bacterium]|nr:DUF4465 domain-containing protein [Bacteroidaceae bacterium]
MKKYFYLVVALCMGFAMTSCDDDDVVITPDTATLTFEGSYWTAKIDNPQNNGPLLYGDGSYAWSDSKTGLSSELTDLWGDGQFWGGGIAISNYIDANISTDEGGHATPDYQLSVPVSNGSRNFAVVYCPASVYLPEGVSYVIKSIDIAPTTYELGVAKYGNGGAKALTEAGDYLTLVITADNGNSVEVDLAREGQFLEGWTTIDLTGLGKVNSLDFSMTGSDSSWGFLNTPTYFAFDNVVVSLKEEEEPLEM